MFQKHTLFLQVTDVYNKCLMKSKWFKHPVTLYGSALNVSFIQYMHIKIVVDSQMTPLAFLDPVDELPYVVCG